MCDRCVGKVWTKKTTATNKPDFAGKDGSKDASHLATAPLPAQKHSDVSPSLTTSISPSTPVIDEVFFRVSDPSQGHQTRSTGRLMNSASSCVLPSTPEEDVLESIQTKGSASGISGEKACSRQKIRTAGDSPLKSCSAAEGDARELNGMERGRTSDCFKRSNEAQFVQEGKAQAGTVSSKEYSVHGRCGTDICFAGSIDSSSIEPFRFTTESQRDAAGDKAEPSLDGFKRPRNSIFVHLEGAQDVRERLPASAQHTKTFQIPSMVPRQGKVVEARAEVDYHEGRAAGGEAKSADTRNRDTDSMGGSKGRGGGKQGYMQGSDVASEEANGTSLTAADVDEILPAISKESKLSRDETNLAKIVIELHWPSLLVGLSIGILITSFGYKITTTARNS